VIGLAITVAGFGAPRAEKEETVRFVGVGRPAQIDDVRKRFPGPGQVLIRIAGRQVVVVGVGGLAHMAIQLLRVLARLYDKLKAGRIAGSAVLIPA
jgi:D-arabinose 1-dehydrogenase-like Zn-dependent alcohol dehydrogenase